MVGMPSYRHYQAHMATHHASSEPMSRGEFFRNRQAARYEGRGRGGVRCC